MYRIVHNVLRIRGTVLDVDRCIQHNIGYNFKYTNGKIFCFNALVPEPFISSENWRIKNWGCDIEICIPTNKIVRDTRVLDNKFIIKTIIFDTHKTPPLKWFKKLCKEFPNLKFELVCDPGWWGIIPIPRFYKYHYKDGSVVLEKRDWLDFFRYNYLVTQK